MHDQLANLLIDLSSEIFLLFRFRSIVISFLSQMVGVLLGHQLDDVLFDLIDNKFLLFDRSMLNHGLENPATIMFVDKFSKFTFITN
jgi:hypothetical protein